MKIKELVSKLNPVKVNYCGKENIEVKIGRASCRERV